MEALSMYYCAESRCVVTLFSSQAQNNTAFTSFGVGYFLPSIFLSFLLAFFLSFFQSFGVQNASHAF